VTAAAAMLSAGLNREEREGDNGRRHDETSRETHGGHPGDPKAGWQSNYTPTCVLSFDSIPPTYRNEWIALVSWNGGAGATAVSLYQIT
jgi:hypothetical protein